MEIRRGSTLDLNWSLSITTDDGETPIDNTNIATINSAEFQVGNICKKYPDDVTFENGCFRVRLSEQETHSLHRGQIRFQAKIRTDEYASQTEIESVVADDTIIGVTDE